MGKVVLLLIGHRMSDKGPTQKHPLVHGKEQYFFAFVVAVPLSGGSGLISVYEGVDRMGEIKTPGPRNR
ncbi:MAG: cation transporter [Halobacteria archaeon]